MTAQYATADDPSSGGRQMPGHYGHPTHNIVSVSRRRSRPRSSTRSASRWRPRSASTGQVAMTFMGEGASNQGDVHEGLNFAAIHKLPFVFVVENNGYAISVPAEMSWRAGRRGPRRPATASPASSSTATDVLACYAASPRGGGPRPRRRRADAHRGQGDPADRALVGRPADEVPLGRGAGGRARAATRCRSSASSCATPACSTDEIEARGRPPRSRPSSRTPPTTPSRGPDPTIETRSHARRTPRAMPRARSTDADPDVHRGDPRRA